MRTRTTASADVTVYIMKALREPMIAAWRNGKQRVRAL
jgi:hypothetical protein